MKKGIAIAGFMGSGKTTLARAFSTEVGAPFWDLDRLVEQSVKMHISQLFIKKGEGFFRETEYAELSSLQKSEGKPYILALGGGTPFVKGVHPFDKWGSPSKC